MEMDTGFLLCKDSGGLPKLENLSIKDGLEE